MADKTSIWKINNVNILESLNSKLLLQMYMINLLVVQKTEIKTCIETQCQGTKQQIKRTVVLLHFSRHEHFSLQFPRQFSR